MLSNGAGLKVPGGKCGYLKEYERENAGKKNTSISQIWQMPIIMMCGYLKELSCNQHHNFSLT